MWNSIHYHRNEIILSEQASTEKIYYIVKGSLELSSKYEATKTLRSGDVFGELNLIQNSPVCMTVKTKSDVLLKEIFKDEFLNAIDTEPELAKRVLETLFQRCKVMTERLQELEANTTHNRIMQMAAKQAQQSGVVLRGISSRARDALNDRELVMDRFPFHFCRKPDLPGPLAYMSNYLLLNDDIPYEISQKHCYIISKDNRVLITDNSSRFGTIVDGESIGRKFARQEYELSPGTHRIHLGPSSHCHYSFEIEVNQGL